MVEQKTPEEIKASILQGVASNLDTREGSFIDDVISPTALELFKTRAQFESAIDMAFPSEDSGEYLDMRSSEYGIIRKPGIKAKAMMHFKGDNGTTVPKGKVFLTSGNLEYIMMNDCIIAGGAAMGAAEAAEIGTKYNVDAGEISMQYVNLQGVTSVLNDAATGGMDAESNKSLFTRLDEFRKTPATSGNKNHYKSWAKETNGVGDAKVTPMEFGAGTVGILIVGQDMQPASQEIVQACAAHIEELRPIGAAVTVKSAQALQINIRAVVKLGSTTSVEAVRAEFAKKMDDYLKKIAFEQYTLLYNRVAFMLLDTIGVEDYTALTINGGTKNIALRADQVPVLGVLEVLQ